MLGVYSKEEFEHYRRAGQMLIEAKDQVGYGGWGRWLAKNFDLTDRTARQYMRMARNEQDFGSGASEVRYSSPRRRKSRQRPSLGQCGAF